MGAYFILSLKSCIILDINRDDSNRNEKPQNLREGPTVVGTSDPRLRDYHNTRRSKKPTEWVRQKPDLRAK